MSSPPPRYTIRPFRPNTSDISGISDVSALGNANDELTRYMTRNIHRTWTSYRNSCCRFLRALVLRPGAYCSVAEDASTRQIVGWAIWSRAGTSTTAKKWRAPNSGLRVALERKLVAAEQAYYRWVPSADATRDQAHTRDLAPALHVEWPPEIFAEYWELDGMYVHPAHYRRGIGRRLAEWGLERGREEGVCVLVHASPMGRMMYESVGFEVMKRETGFDAFVPEFIAAIEAEGEEGMGCWTMGWQYEGGDEVERCRKKYAEEKVKLLGKASVLEGASPAEAISVT